MSGKADALNAHIISPVLVEFVLEGVGSSLVSSTQQASTSTSTSCTSTSTSTSTWQASTSTSTSTELILSTSH